MCTHTELLIQLLIQIRSHIVSSSSSSLPAVHFCTYKDKFISLYCRLSSVLDLDALITQQALREAITDSEVTTAKHRHQLVLDYIQVRDTLVYPACRGRRWTRGSWV